MRIPYATILLCLAVVIPYYLAAGDSFYLQNKTLSAFSFGLQTPTGVFSYLFTHVGLMHLIGNLIPLAIFGLLLESILPSLDVLLIFLLSGFVSGLAFVLLNVNVFLAGASTGVAGLMTAATMLTPRKAITCLLVVGALIFYIMTPAVAFGLDFRLSNWQQEQQQLIAQAEELSAQGKVAEAASVQAQANAVFQKVEQTQAGMEREKQTPTDFWVHVAGALVGSLYVFLFKKKELKKGIREFEQTGDQLFDFFERLFGKRR
ncbi:MAG: rhomboid family intramembrane serine protease [Candidatus Micrarchaeota archaeon]